MKANQTSFKVQSAATPSGTTSARRWTRLMVETMFQRLKMCRSGKYPHWKTIVQIDKRKRGIFYKQMQRQNRAQYVLEGIKKGKHEKTSSTETWQYIDRAVGCRLQSQNEQQNGRLWSWKCAINYNYIINQQNQGKNLSPGWISKIYIYFATSPARLLPLYYLHLSSLCSFLSSANYEE